MISYFKGYYCLNPQQIRLLNSSKVRNIFKILRGQHHVPITATEIASKARINLKTVYALLDRLKESGLVKSINDTSQRGRPTSSSSNPRSKKFFLEEGQVFSSPFKDSIVSAGFIPVEDGFKKFWSQIVDPNETTDIILGIQRLINNLMSRVKDSTGSEIKKWAPTSLDVNSQISYCPGCGINHESIEFIRALIMCLLEQLEKKDEFFQFLRENRFVTSDLTHIGGTKNVPLSDKYFLLKKVARLNPKKPVFYVGSKNPNGSKLVPGSNIIFFKLKNKSILILASGKIEKIERAQPEHRKPQEATDKTRIVHVIECNIFPNPIRLNPDLHAVFGNAFDIDLKNSIIPITARMFKDILTKRGNSFI